MSDGWVDYEDAATPVPVVVPTAPSNFGITDAIMSGLPGRDEVYAAGRTVGKSTLGKLFDLATGANLSEGTPGEIYDRELAKTRGEEAQYFKENPIKANTASILGNTVVPVGEANSMFQAAKTGAGIGSVYGFAGGEGSFQDRITNALFGAGVGGAGGGLFYKAGEGLTNLAGKAEELAQSTKNKIFGLRSSDIRQSLSKGVRQRGDEAPIINSLNRLVASGDLKAGDSVANRVNVETQLDEIGKVIPQILGAADSVRPGPIRTLYNNTRKYISSLSDDEQAGAQAILDRISKAHGGRVSFVDLQHEQSALARAGAKSIGMTGSEQAEANVKKYIALDLKQSIDKELSKPVYEEKLGSSFNLIKQVRQALSDRHQVLPSLIAGEAREATTTIPDILKGLLRTTGGYGLPAAIGYNEEGIPGAVKGLAAGAAFQSNTGQRILAGSLRNLFAPAAAVAGRVAPALALAPEILRENMGKESTPSSPAFVDYTTSENGATPDMPKVLSVKKTSTPELNPLVDNLAPALVHQESTGNPNAVSPKGATGLWQVMPETAKGIAKELGIEKYDLKDPETSEKFGKFYLSKMLDQFGDDPRLALAAYNAGPGNVATWMRKYQTTDWGVIAKRLKDVGAFKETTDYVDRILKSPLLVA